MLEGMGVAVRRTETRFRLALPWDGLTQLGVLGVCFAAGAIGGFLFSSWGQTDPKLLEYLSGYFQAVGQGNHAEPSLWRSVWDLARWPAVAVLLSSTALGVFGLPILLGVRGFLLTYAAATFVRLFGLPGMAASLVSFGVTALVAVPVLFVTATDAFCQSLGRLSGERTPALDQRIQVLTPCAGLLVLAVALQQTLMPALLTAVCARLFIL